MEPLAPSPEAIYVSSSPTPYEGLSKGELMYIEDIEVCSSRSHPMVSENPQLTLFLTPLTYSDAHPKEGPPPFTLEHYPSLPASSATPPSSSLGTDTSPVNIFPTSPREAPTFMDVSFLNSLSIFYDKSPISPSTLPLDSICFKNVTICKAKNPSS